jgi:hypothetical protein
MQRKDERREEAPKGWRDKPVDAERDKDIKEGGIGGARQDQDRNDRPNAG